MSFPYTKLKTKSGSIEAHIFESSYVGLNRDLFLDLHFDFLPIEYASESWNCSFSCEWIKFPGGSWKNIEKINISSDCLKQAEASFYMWQHDHCELEVFNISYMKDNLFKVHIEALVDFSGYFGGDENPKMPIKIDTIAPFNGFSVDRNLFFPKPNTADDAIKLASEFIKTDSFHLPIEKKSLFKFVPKA